MARLPKFYVHRLETETIERVVEYCVQAPTAAEARVQIIMNPDAYPSDRPGSGTVGKVIERRVGPMLYGVAVEHRRRRK